MAAIITNKFRINNAEQFVESFSEASPETYYLFIGRAHSWASDADVQGNTIAEGTDASPPTPNDDVTSEFYNWDDMLGAKIIASTDVSYCNTEKKLDNRYNLRYVRTQYKFSKRFGIVVQQIFLIQLML